MYGMMPSAKIENCSSAPPENRLTRPSTESLHLVEELAPAPCRRCPGSGWRRRRGTPPACAKVNSSRRRSSGMRPAFWNPSSTGRSPRRCRRRLRWLPWPTALNACALTVSALRQRRPAPSTLIGWPRARPGRARQRRRVDHRAGLEHGLELGEVDDAVLDAGTDCGSRASAGGAAAASGRLRSAGACCRRSARRGPCGRGRRSCRARSPGRGRAACAAEREPGAGERSLRSIVLRLHAHQVRDLADHPAGSARRRARSRVLPTRVRPSPRSVCALALGLPDRAADQRHLRSSVRPPSLCLRRVSSATDLAAPRRDLLRAVCSSLQRRDRRLHHVVRVVRAEALGQHVAHARDLDDRAHAAAGDHAGAVAGRAQQHVAGAVAAVDVERDRAVDRAARSPGLLAPPRSPCGSPPALPSPCRGRSRPARCSRRPPPARRS